jgi:hypothetical protein
MENVAGRALQFSDRPEDEFPRCFPRRIAAFNHIVNPAARDEFSFNAVLFDNQVRRAPHVEIGCHALILQ